MSDEYLKPEDYTEPECPLCMNDTGVTPIDTRRFISKLDAYYSKNDYDGAERHLLYWLEEAKRGNDMRGCFTVYNEMMGYYRKQGKQKEAYETIDKAEALIVLLQIEDNISAGTAYVNIATVYKTFNESNKALPYFEKAKKIYEKELNESDSRLGGLYNNMALSLSDSGRYEEAMEYYEKAVSIMFKNAGGELEAAISYLNMANCVEAMLGLEKAEGVISGYIEKAKTLIDTPALPRNGYYAFVCEKCAPTFDYYGFFLYAIELKGIAKKIYEGT